MKLSHSIVGLLFAIFLCACCKKDSEDADNTWRVNGYLFTATKVSYTYDTTNGYEITATNKDNTAPSIVFSFAKMPTARLYKVGSNVRDTNNVFIAASYYDGYFYTYVCDSKDNTNAEVTINGGKISVTLPSCNAYSATKLPDVKISAKAISE